MCSCVNNPPTEKHSVMSSTRLVSHQDQTTTTTTSHSLPASPTPPPFVLTGKTSPVQAKLTTSHASSNNYQKNLAFPVGDLHRQASPIEAIEAKTYRNSRNDRGGVEVGSSCGSMESAASLLQSLKEDDDYLVGKKRRSLMLSQSTSSSAAGRGSSAESSPVNKRYVKMGILTPESPAEVSTYRSHQFNNGGGGSGSINRSTGMGPSLSPSSTPPPPYSGAATQSTGRNISSSHQQVSQGTPPIKQSSTVDGLDFSLVHRNLPSSPYHSEDVSVSQRPYLQDVCPSTCMDYDGGDEIKVEGYEVIDLKDVSAVVDSANRDFVVVPVQQNVQPSPPISMKSESVSVHSEESTSSPDSGYGNTPEYPNANTAGGGEAKSVEESSGQNGVRDLHHESKLRAGSDDTDGGFNSGACHSDSNNMANGGDSHLLIPSQQPERERAGEGGDLLTRPSTGSSSSAVVSDCSSSEQRSRGGTNESLFSVESIISSPPVQSSEGGATSSRTDAGPGGRGSGGDTQQVVGGEKQRTKMYLGRQASLPPSVSDNVRSNTTPRTQPNSAGPFPFHTSPSSGSLNYVTRSPGFSELHPSHPSHPSRSQPPTAAVGGGGGVPSSQSYHNIYRQVRRSPEPRKKRFRSGSFAFNRSAGTVKSVVVYTLSCHFDAKGQ